MAVVSRRMKRASLFRVASASRAFVAAEPPPLRNAQSHFPTMSATAAFFAVRAPVRVSVAQVRPRVPARPSRAPQIGFIDSRLDASRGCSRARKSDRRPPLLVPAKP